MLHKPPWWLVLKVLTRERDRAGKDFDVGRQSPLTRIIDGLAGEHGDYLCKKRKLSPLLGVLEFDTPCVLSPPADLGLAQ